MNNMGVFAWIRENVRRSVLLGFSDAVEQLGTAGDGNEQIHPQLAAVLRDAAAPALTDASATSSPQANRGSRKRLGRSLDHLRRGGTSTDDAE